MKKFISGILIGTILSTCVVVFAADVKITAIKSAFSLLVNGKAVKMDKPLITVNGDYYVSAKQLSSALGLKFNVNSKTKNVEIGLAATPKPTETPAPKPTELLLQKPTETSGSKTFTAAELKQI